MMTIPLNDKQLDLLRYLYRQTGPALSDHLDGRVARGLRSRGMVEEKGGWLTLTDTGRPEFEKLRRGRVRNPPAEGGSPRQARAEAIIRAVEALELALPRGSEGMVGDMPAYSDDVLAGLRGFARRPPPRTGAERSLTQSRGDPGGPRCHLCVSASLREMIFF